MTPTTRRILEILRDHPGPVGDPGMRATEVAKKLWPDSIGWRKMTMGSNGFPGKTMPAKAGALLNRLEKAGLVHIRFRRDDGRWHKDGEPRTLCHHYYLSTAGRKALAEALAGSKPDVPAAAGGPDGQQG